MQRLSDFILHRLGNRRLARALVLSGLLALVLGTPMAQAQGSATAEVAVTAAQQELSAAVLERFDVVILSRGLLLEPLDEDAEFRAIEVTSDGLVVDGEDIAADDLYDRLDDEEADLLVGLSELDIPVMKALFEGVGFDIPEPEEVVEASVTISLEDDEDEADKEKDSDERRHRKGHKKDAQVIVGSSHTVDEDEISREILVVGGELEIRGEVVGNAVAIGGPVTVSGEVTGDVSSVGSTVYLESGAFVRGDVVSMGGTVEREEDVTVQGDVVEVPFGPSFRFGAFPWTSLWRGDGDWHDAEDVWRFSPMRAAMGAFWKIFGVVILSLLACLALLLGRGPVARMERRIVAEPWKCGLVGLVAQILFLPLLILVVVVLAISIIGIPLLLLVPFALFALMVVCFLGFVAVAQQLGSVLKERFGWQVDSPYMVVALGVLVIQIWGLIGSLFDVGWGPLWFIAVMFFVFSAVVKYVVWTVGFGAALLTRFGTKDTWGGSAAAPLPPLPAGPDEGTLDDFGFADEAPEAAGPDEGDWEEPEDTESPKEP
ncbi:MAG: hypothetical protein WBI27_01950, partial [Thermoanaerobaculia bacterium]